MFIKNIIQGSDGMKLVVGLGNPSKAYENTRHNVGFSFLDYYLEEKFEDVVWSKKNNGLIYSTVVGGEKILFLKPQTYMNLSGDAVHKVVDYYNIDLNDILIISDDLDLNIGNFKLKLSGSSGGHNGIKDIQNKLNSNDIKRLKIGISNNKGIDTKDYVLSEFNRNEIKKLKEVFKELCLVMDDYFVLSFEDLMNKYNRKNR